MAPTYMISIPLITNGIGGNQSTFHQNHVEMLHRGAFRQLRSFANLMLSEKVRLPVFARPACSLLDETAL